MEKQSVLLRVVTFIRPNMKQIIEILGFLILLK